MIVNKNKIEHIHNKPGFRGLKSLSFEDNLINNWKTFDELNEFECRLQQIRCGGNPIVKEDDTTLTRRSRQTAIARMEFLKKFNGTPIEGYERKDFEIFYLKIVLETYLKEVLQV